MRKDKTKQKKHRYLGLIIGGSLFCLLTLGLLIAFLYAKPYLDMLEEYHENDIAEALEFLTKEERKALYDAWGIERVSEIFAYLEDATIYFEELGLETAAEIIENMDSDDAVDILESFDEEIGEQIVWLQSLEEPGLCFLLFNPSQFEDFYKPEITEEIEKLKKELSKLVNENVQISIVDIKKPEHILSIDVRENKETYMYEKVVYGVGGMPVGTSEMVCFCFLVELIAPLQVI